jgi:hypothetical protein
LKAGIVDPSQGTPRRKGAVLHTEAGGNQFETANLPFRRPKNVSLLDQLNRIDMIGFHRFLEVLGGKSADTNSPPRSQRHTGVWTPNSPQAPRGQRRGSINAPRRGSLSSSSQPPKLPPKLGSHLVQTLDEGSVAKPASSIAGACKYTRLSSLCCLASSVQMGVQLQRRVASHRNLERRQQASHQRKILDLCQRPLLPLPDLRRNRKQITELKPPHDHMSQSPRQPHQALGEETIASQSSSRPKEWRRRS